MFFMGAVEFIKNCPPWGSGIKVEVISLQINSTAIPRDGGGAVEYIDWCITAPQNLDSLLIYWTIKSYTPDVL